MENDDVLVAEVRGRVGVVTFNRPSAANSLTPQLLGLLRRTLMAWRESGQVRAVVITGSGDRAFSAGYDVGSIPVPGSGDKVDDIHPMGDVLEVLKDFPYPTIAMIRGFCLGAGLNLALCCDIRIATDTATLGMPPAKLGVVYDIAGIQQILRVVGSPRAREILLGGRRYRGPAAEQMGLVDHVFDIADIETETFALAEEIAANAPLAVTGMKRILNLIDTSVQLSEDARAEAERLFLGSLSSEDAKEAKLAFREKRPPVFVGR